MIDAGLRDRCRNRARSIRWGGNLEWATSELLIFVGEELAAKDAENAAMRGEIAAVRDENRAAADSTSAELPKPAAHPTT